MIHADIAFVHGLVGRYLSCYLALDVACLDLLEFLCVSILNNWSMRGNNRVLVHHVAILFFNLRLLISRHEYQYGTSGEYI